MKQIAGMVLVLAGLALGFTAQAASFDCGKAATKVEKMICADAKLSKLDEVLNADYKTALQDEKQAKAVRQAQKRWLKKRNRCTDTVCLEDRYFERLEKLQAKDVGNHEPIEVDRTYPPKPYTLVMSKDKELCNHMLQLFNDDLAEHGWGGSNFHDRHEEFKQISWGKARASYESSGRIQYTDVEGALFDFNNDGVQDFVVWDKSCCLSGMRFDEIFMLDADVIRRANDLTYKELGDGNNVIDIAGDAYPLSEPSFKGQSEALWLLSPFKYHDTFYLFMHSVALDRLSHKAVIAKYKNGRFIPREMTGKMEDICYYQH